MRDFFFLPPAPHFFGTRSVPARSSPLVGVGGDKTDPFFDFFPYKTLFPCQVWSQRMLNVEGECGHLPLRRIRSSLNGECEGRG